MLLLNDRYYRAPDRAPQMHSGTADFRPDPDIPGELPMVPSGISQASQEALPQVTWGAVWAQAPAPGASGESTELIAIWSGLPEEFPTIAADLRPPGILRVKERQDEDALFTTAAAFKGAVAAREEALERAVACFEINGVRHATLNTNYSNASEGAETRDIFRLSDATKVGEAFIYRSSSSVTVQHWVLFNDERFDLVRVVKRTSGGYASLSAFLTAMANAKPSGVNWPHAVETCTHYLSCPW